MTHNNTLLGGKLALATVVATGMVAAPVALNPSFLPQPSAAVAQDTGSESNGAASESNGATSESNGAASESNGAAPESNGAGSESNGAAVERAEERMTPTPAANSDVYEILGTTREEAEQADTVFNPTTSSGPLRGYQEAVENDRLDSAAENLAAVAKRPITEDLVLQVNEALGIETRLTAHQIAEQAARKQQAAN